MCLCGCSPCIAAAGSVSSRSAGLGRRMKGWLNGRTTSCECILLSLCAYSYIWADCRRVCVCVCIYKRPAAAQNITKTPPSALICRSQNTRCSLGPNGNGSSKMADARCKGIFCISALIFGFDFFQCMMLPLLHIQDKSKYWRRWTCGFCKEKFSTYVCVCNTLTD